MDVQELNEKIVLGHMPLVGVSYQSREKDDEYRKKFSNARTMKGVIDAALRFGVRTFATASPGFSQLASLHLNVLKQVVDEGYDIKTIPCIGISLKIDGKEIDAFRRWATYLTIEERLYPKVKNRVLDDPILNFREGWKQKLPVSKPYDAKDIERLDLNWKRIENELIHFNDLPVAYMEPGSETDFLVMTGRFDLLGMLIDKIKEQDNRKVLFGVHHAGISVPRLDEELKDFDGYVTPINPLGIMMFPTKDSAVKAIKGTNKKVFAIKPLAGGRINPGKAFSYVFNLDIEGCMIGAGSVTEVEEDFKIAFSLLQKKLS